MSNLNKDDELPKHVYNYFQTNDIIILLNNGEKLKGHIAREYTYDLLFRQKIKDKDGNKYIKEIIVPKHSICYTYRYIKND